MCGIGVVTWQDAPDATEEHARVRSRWTPGIPHAGLNPIKDRLEKRRRGEFYVRDGNILHRYVVFDVRAKSPPHRHAGRDGGVESFSPGSRGQHRQRPTRAADGIASGCVPGSSSSTSKANIAAVTAGALGSGALCARMVIGKRSRRDDSDKPVPDLDGERTRLRGWYGKPLR